MPAPLARPEPDRLTVLIIDDNDTNRFIARSFIESAGHRVVEARNGQAGLIEAQRQRFDVVLTDISMPGLDGLQVAQRIRDGGGPSARSRILALTAHTHSSQQDALQRSGFDGFLQKPVGRAELLGSLKPGAPVMEDVLDLAPLVELEEQLGPAVVATLIRQVLHDGDMIMERIAALGPDPEPMLLRPLAHQFAGAIGTFGAHPLHRLLRRMMAAAEDNERLTADRTALPALWETTRRALEERARVLAQTGK